jgi:acetolactate synthase-1/2/3 large subunit
MIQELGTIFQKVPVKIVILNNEFLGMVRQQNSFFDKRYASTEMTNPNFVATEGYYIKAKKGNQKRRFRCCCRRKNDSKDSYLLKLW